jgi:serine/threonine-protein kinase
MAPEQAMGGKIGLTTDVYSAGCVLFELFTGRLPFMEESQGDLLRAHMISPVPKMAEAAENKIRVVPEMQAFIERAMGKSPDKRFQNAGEMLNAFVNLPQPAVVLAKAAKPALGAVQRAAVRPIAATTERAPPSPASNNRVVLIAVAVVVISVVATVLALR